MAAQKESAREFRHAPPVTSPVSGTRRRLWTAKLFVAREPDRHHTVTSLAAQTDPQENDVHHPAQTQAAPVARRTPGCSPAAATAVGMPDVMGGQGIFYRAPVGTPEKMTEDRVRALMEGKLTNLCSPHPTLGEIGTAADGSTIAAIVTAEGALVEKLSFNRSPGLVRQVSNRPAMA